MNCTIEMAIQQFLIEQELKGNTPATIKNYQLNLKYFSEFIGKDIVISDLKLMHLRNYLINLRSRKKSFNQCFKPKNETQLSTISIQSYVRHLRVFLRWLHQEGYIEENLHQQFKLPKAVKKTIEVLSDEEIGCLMKSMKQNTEMGLRNTCMVALMLDCGLRRNEVLQLDYDNVHILQGIIKVFGKGHKERIVPMGLYTKKVLMKYMNGYRSMPQGETNRLFVDKNLNPVSGNALKQLFVRLKARTKIGRLHPHILRHTFATKYLMNGGDVFSLQQIMGHTSLEMVRRYSHLASSYVVDRHKKFSPLDNVYKRD